MVSASLLVAVTVLIPAHAAIALNIASGKVMREPLIALNIARGQVAVALDIHPVKVIARAGSTFRTAIRRGGDASARASICGGI